MKKRHLFHLLLAVGALHSAGRCVGEEAAHQVLTALSTATLSGYVSTTTIWNFSPSRPVTVIVPGNFSGLLSANMADSSTLNLANHQLLSGGSVRLAASPAKGGPVGSIPALGGDIFISGVPAKPASAPVDSQSEISLELRQSGNERISVITGTPLVPSSASITAIQTAATELKATGGNIYALAINNGATGRARSAFATHNGRLVLKSDHNTAINTITGDVPKEVSGNNGNLVYTSSKINPVH